MASSQSDSSSVVSASDRSGAPIVRPKRQFGSALSGKPGVAKFQRELVTQAVRQSSALTLKPKLTPPLDYESFFVKYRTVLDNDPCRNALFFPDDDITQNYEPQKYRTAVPSVTNNDLRDAKLLLVQQCLKQYTCNWSLVHFNYAKYGTDYTPLVKEYPSEELNELTYEVDLLEEQTDDSFSEFGNPDNEQRVVKEGFLLRGPDSASDVGLVNFRTFKKRYCYLRQDLDGSYKLDFCKDKPKVGSTSYSVKSTIYLEFCSDVLRSTKRGKYFFELKLAPQDSATGKSIKSTIQLAAENEAQLEEWLYALQTVLEKISKIAKRIKSEETTSVSSSHASESDSGREDTLKTLKPPDFDKFMRESDDQIFCETLSPRQNIFAVYSELEPLTEAVEQTAFTSFSVKPCSEKFGIRFLVECKTLTALLPVPGEKGQMASQVEPFFISLFLFDPRDGGRRLSENFYDDLNPALLQKYAHGDVDDDCNGINIPIVGTESKEMRMSGEPELRGLSANWLWSTGRKALFSIAHPHSDVYLVVRIDKILQGGISSGQELYLRPDAKSASKFQKTVPKVCSQLGRYRMPFAWAAKPVFQQFIGSNANTKETISLYKQEADKLSDQDLAKLINELKKPEKSSNKLQPLSHSSVTVRVDVSIKAETLTHCVTSNYLPVALSSPKNSPSSNAQTNGGVIEGEEPPIFEIEPCSTTDDGLDDVQPHVYYRNHLYVYPLLLKYDSQRHFSKARNICCWVEFRDSDKSNATPLKCLYGRYGVEASPFVYRVGTTVIHHETSPNWYDEVKIALPVHLHERHHVLMTYVHVGVESTQKKKPETNGRSTENVVGYSWFPLLKNGRLCLDQDFWLPVAATLPEGYLSSEPLGLGKGFAGPDVKWVDSARPLLHVSGRLSSTVLTRDLPLQTFFNNCQRLKENGTLGDAASGDRTKAQGTVLSDTVSANNANATTAASFVTGSIGNLMVLVDELIKCLSQANTRSLIEFLPAILNQLFDVLASAASEETALNVVRPLVYIVHEACKANKREVLKAYLKYVFRAPESKEKTVHDELAKLMTLLLRPARTEQATTSMFLRNAWFFMDVIVKSMCQYLLCADKLQANRTEHFTAEFQYKIDTFIETLTLYLCQKYKELPGECKAASKSLAYFLRACLSLMDRGFVFGLIYFVCQKFDTMESKTLKQYKVDFLQIVCQHEHFVPLNIPLLCSKDGGGPYRKNASDTNGGALFVITTVEEVMCSKASVVTADMEQNDYLPKKRPSGFGLLQRLLTLGAGMFNNTGMATGVTNIVQCGVESNSETPVCTDFNDFASNIIAMDLAHEFRLTDDYCANHYLVGLLLRHIDYSICESRDLRQRLIAILRNLLAKHSYDDRYQGQFQARLATLYFPLIPILMEHLKHLELRDVVSSTTPTNTWTANKDSVVTARRSSSSLTSCKRNTLTSEQSGFSSVSVRHSNSDRDVLNASRRQLSLWDTFTPGLSSRTLSQDSEAGSSTLTSCRSDDNSIATSLTTTPTAVDGDRRQLTLDDMSSLDNETRSVSGSSTVREKSPGVSATLPQMLSQAEPFLAYSRFDEQEIKDLLICAVYVLKNVQRETLCWFWQQCDHHELMEFLRLLDLLLFHFKYQGKQRILKLTSNKLRASSRALKLSPMRDGDVVRKTPLLYKQSKTDVQIADSPFSVLQEAHLAQEVGFVVLDCLAAFVCTQKPLMSMANRSDFLEKICEMYFCMLNRQSSADLMRQTLVSLKLLLKKYPSAFFNGSTNICGSLCRKLLECCNSPVGVVQLEACELLYLLMRMNYEHSQKKSFSRVHQQVIISLSQLLGDGISLNNPVFNRALSILNGFSNTEKYQHHFCTEVKEVVRRQRTVLMATTQLKEHSDDPDMLADLQKSLADSYAQSPRLRETWLQNLARLHVKRQHYAEAAQCYLHMAAMTAEVLKMDGLLDFGSEKFGCVSVNVVRDEKLEDSASYWKSGDETMSYDIDTFVNRIVQCAELMSKCDRYEAMGPIYRTILPILEYRKDYDGLADAYNTLHEAYEKAANVTRTGKRILGTYFRVGFYGQMFFESEHGNEYIYREPSYVSLAEFTERLRQQYTDRFGGDSVRIISDSNPVDIAGLEQKVAHLQITHVEPYFDQSKFISVTGDVYEQHTNVGKFFYDSPYTSDGRYGASEKVVNQCKKRVILSTKDNCFPYIVRRLLIGSVSAINFDPLETAIDEMTTKINELRTILDRSPVDSKRLQLRLQGAIQPTVNAGPLAYASAFCSSEEVGKYGNDKIGQLCSVYRDFLTVCWEALEVNDRVITPDQFEYQQSLLRYFKDTVERLNALFGSQMLQLSNVEQTEPADQTRTARHRLSGKRGSGIFGS